MQRWTVLWTEVADAVTFLSRLPCPRPREAPAGREGSGFLRFAPLAGLIVAALGAAVLAASTALRLPGLAGAALALAVTTAATGALHEDGLADVADGFGGGRTREGKLTIMRDSRIGTFGAAALGIALILRCACLAALADRGGSREAAAALAIAAVQSRAAMLLPMACLAPARPDGLASTVGRLSVASLVVAALLAFALSAVACVAAPVFWPRAAPAALCAACGACAMTWLARRQIGGVTGDVVGAAQQVAEVAVLLTLSAGVSAIP